MNSDNFYRKRHKSIFLKTKKELKNSSIIKTIYMNIIKLF